MSNVITISEFNTNQNHFLELAKKGVDIMLKSSIFGNFKIVPVAHEETKEDNTIYDNPNSETIAAIEEAKQHIKEIHSGAEITGTVDLSSIDAMLKSCGI